MLRIRRIKMASQWAQWRLKSPASRLFTEPFIQGADQRKHQSSASLAFVRGIYRLSVNFPHKRPVTRKIFLFDDVIMGRETVLSLTRGSYNGKTTSLYWDGPPMQGQETVSPIFQCHVIKKAEKFPIWPVPWNRSTYPCFCIFLIEFGGISDVYKHKTNSKLCQNGNNICASAWNIYSENLTQTNQYNESPMHSAPTGARNSSLGHPNMAEASLGKNFPKVISSLLLVFSGWYLQRLVSWCVSLSRPQNIWCKRRQIARRRGDISPRDARISTSV